jgi:hypothetical protein
MPSEYRSSFIYSAVLARKACLSILWDRCAALMTVTPAIFVLALLFLGSSEYASLAGFVLGVVVVFWASWLAGVRRAGRVAVASGNPEVQFIMTDEACTFRTAQAETVMKWSGIADLYRLRRFWVFARAGVIYASFVPLEALSAEAQAFAEKQVRAAGGRVR